MSGRRILKAIVAGETDPAKLAALGGPRLAASRSDLADALHGRVREHHRFLIDQHLKTIEQLEATIAPAQGDAIIVPIKPTHVSTELLQVFKEAGGAGDVVQQLPPFTTVTLVKSDQGWVLIARDGKLLGYAAEAKLHKLN
jgi:hypothetical protein